MLAPSKLLARASLGASLALASCGPGPEAVATAASAQVFTPILGEGYDVWRNELLDTSCVSFDPADMEVFPPSLGEVHLETNMDFESVQRALKGHVELGLDLGTFSLEGSVDYASELAETAFVSSITLYQTMEHGAVRVPEAPGKVKLNAAGRTLVESFDPAEFERRCGTHFIAGKKLGGVFFGSLVFRFASTTDKVDFDARLALEIGSFGSGSAEVRAALANAGGKATIRIIAHQEGGRPERMGQALSGYIADCSAENREPCYQAFEEMRRYMVDFADQLRNAEGALDPSRLAVRSVTRATYDATGDPRLLARNLDQSIELEARRRSAVEQISDDTTNRALAQAVVDSAYVLDPTQRRKINGIIDVIETRIALFRAALEDCHARIVSVEACLDRLAAAEAAAAGPLAYEVGDLVVVTRSFYDYCVKLRTWHDAFFGEDASRASVVMDEDERRTLVSILDSEGVQSSAELRDVVIEGRMEPVSIGGRTVVTDRKGVFDAEHISPDVDEFDCKAYARAVLSLTTFELRDASHAIKNLEPFASIPSLRSLDLSNDKLPWGVLPLAKLPYLETLKLASTRITSLKGLGIRSLRTLDASGNRLGEGALRDLAGATGLTDLDVSGSLRLRGLDVLRGHPKLKTLDISGTAVTAPELAAFLERTNVEFPLLRTVIASGGACSPAPTDARVRCR